MNKDDNCDYYHTDPYFASKVKTRYEFEWISNDDISFKRKNVSSEKNKIVDFLKLDKSPSITLSEQISRFESMYVNQMYQFDVDIGKKLTLMTEIYDSTTIYKQFYSIETKNGYGIYTLYKNHLLLFF